MRAMRIFVLVLVGLFSLAMNSCLDRDNGLDTASQQQKDLETIDNFLKSNSIDAIKDKSGVRYSFTTLGKGFPPRSDQTIKAKYIGRFMDGTVFDDGDPSADGTLNSFILGWQYGLAVWPVGSKGKLYVPSTLGYGSQQINSIPPNSILVFDIELTEVVQSNADKARFTADTTAIEKYLKDNEIEAETDSTGIRFVITNPGAGQKPSLFSKVKINYTGKAMASGNEFFNGSIEPSDLFDSRVVDFINGLKVGMMKLAIGGKGTFYIPSGLAFGPNELPSSGLPANSNVIYEVELVDLP